MLAAEGSYRAQGSGLGGCRGLGCEGVGLTVRVYSFKARSRSGSALGFRLRVLGLSLSVFLFGSMGLVD